MVTSNITSLAFATNLSGALKPSTVAKIQTYIENPTFDNWDEIKGIIISSKSFITIWQAVQAIDPSFPLSGRVKDETGFIVKEWAKKPSAELLIKAVSNCIYSNNINYN